MNCKLSIKKITVKTLKLENFQLKYISSYLVFTVMSILITITSCTSNKTQPTIPNIVTPNQLSSMSGFEDVLKEPDGDIMEFDVSKNAQYIAYSTNAYKNVFQIFLLDMKENKKQYVIPEEVEQYSPKIDNDDLYFVRIDKGTSYLTSYDIKQNLSKTIFKVNSTILTISVNNGNISFAVNDKGSWKIWLFQDNKFILIDNGFYPSISNDTVYYQKPNEKESQFYSIFAQDFSRRQPGPPTNTKYSILYHSAKSFLNPSLSKNGELLSYVEFSDSTYYLKILNLKNNQQYTLLKSPTPILSPNLNVDGYIYFILQNEGKFSIYRFKL